MLRHGIRHLWYVSLVCSLLLLLSPRANGALAAPQYAKGNAATIVAATSIRSGESAPGTTLCFTPPNPSTYNIAYCLNQNQAAPGAIINLSGTGTLRDCPVTYPSCNDGFNSLDLAFTWQDAAGVDNTLGPAITQPDDQIGSTFNFTFNVPDELPNTAHQLCVAFSFNFDFKSPVAGRACVNFLVILGPPGSVTGTVYERVAGEPTTAANDRVAATLTVQPAAGATVTLKDTTGNTNRTTTDAGGRFTFSNVPRGSYELSAAKSGSKQSAVLLVVYTGQTTNRDIVLGSGDAQFQGPDIIDLSASLNGFGGGGQIGTFLSLPQRNVPVMNTFSIFPGPGKRGPAAGAVYTVTTATNVVIDTQESEDATQGFPVRIDMSQLPVGQLKLTVQAYELVQVIPNKPPRRLYGNPITRTIIVRGVPLLDRPDATPLTVTFVASPGDSKGGYYLIGGTIPPTLQFQGLFSNIPLLSALSFATQGNLRLSLQFNITGQWSGRINGSAGGSGDPTSSSPRTFSLTASPTVVQGDIRGFGGQAGLSPLFETQVFNREGGGYMGICECAIFFSVNVYVGTNVTSQFATQGAPNAAGDTDPLAQGNWDITPSVYGRGQADVLAVNLTTLGFFNASGSLSPYASLSMPTQYNYRTEQSSLGPACFNFTLDGTVRLRVFWFITARTWSGRFVNFSQCAGASAAGQPLAEEDPWRVLASPTLAVDPEGRMLTLWVHDDTPAADVESPRLYWARRDGATWSEARPLTDGSRYVSQPQVVFTGPNRAIAVWVQNELSRADGTKSIADALDKQAIYFSTYDGGSWSAPARLYSGDRPNGAPALAADPATGQALAVWMRDGDGNFKTPNDTEILWSRWNGTAWGDVAELNPDHTTADGYPRVAFADSDHALVVWVKDTDGDPNTNIDRRLAYAAWDHGVFSHTVVLDEPAGPVAPDLAFDHNGNPLLVFAAQPQLGQDKQPMGIGTNQYLYYAYRRGTKWEIGPIGKLTAVEAPRVKIDANNLATVVMRHFGPVGTVSYGGEQALTQAKLGDNPLVWSPVVDLTRDGRHNWMNALALDSVKGDAVVLNVKSELTPTLQAASTAGLLSGDDERPADIRYTTLLADSDPALLPNSLVLSPTLITAGARVAMSVTVTNLGLRALAAGEVMTVTFATVVDNQVIPLAQTVVPGPLGLGETKVISAKWKATDLHGRLRVNIDSPNDARSDNNMLERDLGLVPSPEGHHTLDLSHAPFVELDWNTTPELASQASVQETSASPLLYYLYRADDNSTTEHLVGSTDHSAFHDGTIAHGHTYTYHILAESDFGHHSSAGAAVVVTVPPQQELFLPLVSGPTD